MIKLMKRIGFAAVIISMTVLVTSCGSSNKAGDDEFVINGKFSSTKSDSVYLDELTLKDFKALDSTMTDENGQFKFKVKISEPGFYVIRINKNNFFTMLMDKGETAEVTGDVRQLASTYTVSGSAGSELIREINQRLRINYEKVDSLSLIYNSSQKKPDFLAIKAKLDSTYFTIVDDQKKFISKFVENHTTSLASLIAIYQMFGEQQMLDPNKDEDFEYYLKLDKGLFGKYPKNKHAIDFHQRVAEIKRSKAEKELTASKLSAGAPAPEIKLETPGGQMMALSSLKGKVVFLDFWASWCNPCRKTNPKLVNYYKQYNKKGLEIYAVSLDKDKEAWTKAIAKDKLTWIQVSDLLYWNSPVAKLYNVTEIPYTILIDRKGRIVSKDTKVENLEAKMLELLNKK